MGETSKIVIKKYPNRRLYNTLTSTYIKLEDLAILVKNNEDFMVVDAKSGDDITRITLVQIILNNEMKGYEVMPESMIKAIIKFHGHPTNKMLQECFSQTIQAFQTISSSNPAFNKAFELGKQIEKQTQENLNYFHNMWFGKSKEK